MPTQKGLYRPRVVTFASVVWVTACSYSDSHLVPSASLMGGSQMALSLFDSTRVVLIIEEGTELNME